METSQLYKRENGQYKPVFPLALLSSILDDESGKALKDIISAYNHLYVPFVNNIYETLTAIPVALRRKGLWVTWETDEGLNTYQFNLSTAEAADDAIWGNIESWEQVPDLDYYNTHAAVPDGSITLEKLSDEIRQWLVNAGKIINYPDREDITEELGLLKFADRQATPGVSSMGYKILRRNKTFAEQVVDENTIYEIKYNFNLNDSSVTIPNNCVLNFNGGSISNGTIIGSNTILKSLEDSFLDNITLNGTFNNCIAHISWFKQTEDITKQLSSLISCFNKIKLEYGGVVSDATMPVISGNFELDGCGSTINPQGCKSLFWTGNAGINRNVFIEIKNLIIDYLGDDKILTTHNNAFAFSIANNGTTSIHDIIIQNFASPGVFSGFTGVGIYVSNSSCTDIRNIKISNCIATGDGVEGSGSGSCVGIDISGYLLSQSVNPNKVGSVLIENCYLDYIQTVDEQGNLIKDDATGIYLALAFYKNGKNVIVNNVSFKDCGKRNVKLQGNGMALRNLKSEWSEDLSTSLAQYYIGSQYSDNIIIENCQGRYPGSFFKMSEGDNCIIRNCVVDVDTFLTIGSNTNSNAIIDNCNVKCDYGLQCTIASLDSEHHTVAYTAIPDKGIVITNSVFNCDNEFCYVADADVYFRQYGKILLSNCKITLVNGLWRRCNKLQMENCEVYFSKNLTAEIIGVKTSLIIKRTKFYCSQNTEGTTEYFINCNASCQEIIVEDSVFNVSESGATFTSGFYLECTNAIRIFKNLKTNIKYGNFIYSTRNALFNGDLIIDNVIGANRFRFANNLNTVIITKSPTSTNNTLDILTNDYANSNFKIFVYGMTATGYFSSTNVVYVANKPNGTFASKPILPDTGFGYYCTDRAVGGGPNGIMIFYYGGVWKNAIGETVS